MTAPESVHELARARQEARAAKDFAKSDEIRNEIAAQGFEVVDVAGGYELRPKKRFATYESTRDIRPINSGKYEITVAMIIDGFHEDAVETIKTIKQHSDCAITMLVLGDAGAIADQLDARTSLVVVTEDFGWGENANALLRNITSEFVIIMDPSTRFTGDAVAPVLAELKKREYVAVGWRGGLVNMEDDWRSVDDKGPGEVDVFCLATSLVCIVRMRLRLVDLITVRSTIATLILNSHWVYAMPTAACCKWSFRSNKTATMAITIQIRNTAMLNRRRITTVFLSASAVRLQFLARAGNLAA